MVAAGDTRLVADILPVAACRRPVEVVVGDLLKVAHRLPVVEVADGDLLREALRLRVVGDILRAALHLRVEVVDGDLLKVEHQAWALRAWVLMRLLPVVMVLRLDKAEWAAG
jgi:hypothetical protein